MKNLQICRVVGCVDMSGLSGTIDAGCSRSSSIVDLLAGICSADIDADSWSEFFKLAIS